MIISLPSIHLFMIEPIEYATHRLPVGPLGLSAQAPLLLPLHAQLDEQLVLVDRHRRRRHPRRPRHPARRRRGRWAAARRRGRGRRAAT